MQANHLGIRIGWFLLVCGSFELGCANFELGLDSYRVDESSEGLSVTVTEDGDFLPDTEEGAPEADAEEEEEPFVDEAQCDEAVGHLDSCGVDYLRPDVCDAQAAAEAGLMVELTCDEMTSAMVMDGPLPLCSWYGWNCDDVYHCGGQVPADDYQELLVYTDLGLIQDMGDVEESFDEIGRVFSEHGDYRGLFPVLMRAPIRNAISAVDAGALEYEEWGDDYVKQIGLLFLTPLRSSLVGQQPEGFWYRYHELMEDCTASPLRIGAVGLTTHLVVDVPEAVSLTGGTDNQDRDFFLMGDVIAASADELIEDLDNSYGIDGQGFLSGVFKDDWSGGTWDSQTAGAFSYETIEYDSWINGLWLQNFWVAWSAESDIWSSFYDKDELLEALDESGSL